MVGTDTGPSAGPLRLVELLASVSLATDLGTGQPPGHALRTCTTAAVLARKVAALAEEAGRLSGLDGARCEKLRHAGFVHDLGRVAVANGIWDKAGPLTTPEWERVRLHPYCTERILHRCGALASLVEPAASHHEMEQGLLG